MGARYITPTEFAYIKALANRKNLSSKKIVELTSRSLETVNRIKDAATFKDYKANKKTVKTPAPVQTQMGIDDPKPVNGEAKPKKDYSGALLGQIHRLTQAISYNNNLIKDQNEMIKKLLIPKSMSMLRKLSQRISNMIGQWWRPLRTANV